MKHSVFGHWARRPIPARLRSRRRPVLDGVRIEEQWMLPEPPRPAIVQAPKRDTFDHILVPLEDREEASEPA